jgi:hypothetical protein
MIRRILCWLGLHEWEHIVYAMSNGFSSYGDLRIPNIKLEGKTICKHCGKVKR